MKFKRLKSAFSLKSQLLIYFILVAFIPTVMLGIYYYHSSTSILRKDIGESNFKVISHIMDNIEKQVEHANNITDWIFADTSVSNLLKRSTADIDRYDMEKKLTVESIARLFQYSPVTRYLLSMLLIGNNSLDIRYGNEAAFINTDDLEQSQWFTRSKQSDEKITWGSVIHNYTKISSNPFVIPQFRRIKDLESGRTLGYSVILFNQGIFSDCYKEVLLNKGEKIYLTDARGNIISTNQSFESEKNICNKPYFKELVRSENRQYFEATIDDSIHLVTYKKSSKTGWILIEIIPMTQVQKQKNVIEATTAVLLVVVIAMSIFLSIFLSENFTRPIKRLVKQVNQIALGNFDHPISLFGRSEIGELAKSITKMKTDIRSLLQDSIQKEKEKRILEIKMLQSQINPHFLYNTLNSIKLMAALQGAKGIENMVGSLGRLLKAALGGLNEKIPLYEEIRILDDYIFIQKIRYKGKMRFSKNIEDESLLHCLIIKFILQPILENTILHGIEPKDEGGAVILSVFRKNNKLILEVWDNGVGMSEEIIKKVQQASSNSDIANSNHGIGLNNINQRIKLVYGDEYGLRFESKEGEFTKVAIELPVELQENDSERGDRG